MPKVEHDRDRCIGCGACVIAAPHSWNMSKKDGKSDLVRAQKKGKVFVGEIFECDREDNQKAAKACPVKIIKVL